MTRDPKTDPQPGDVIRWQGKDRAYVTLVTAVETTDGGLLGRTTLVRWVDVNPNGYADAETYPLKGWLLHTGIQSGTVLFVAPDDAVGVVGGEG